LAWRRLHCSRRRCLRSHGPTARRSCRGGRRSAGCRGAWLCPMRGCGCVPCVAVACLAVCVCVCVCVCVWLAWRRLRCSRRRCLWSHGPTARRSCRRGRRSAGCRGAWLWLWLWLGSVAGENCLRILVAVAVSVSLRILVAVDVPVRLWVFCRCSCLLCGCGSFVAVAVSCVAVLARRFWPCVSLWLPLCPL
jgi:hypothetical protein